MTLNYKFIYLLLFVFIIKSCGNYSFTGASIPEGTESFQVNFFENEAGNSMGSIFEPGLDRDFTIALQDILQNQTNLQLVSSDGDLIYEGEITEYRVSPMTATSNLQASQNRLTVGINVRFTNLKKEDDNFEIDVNINNENAKIKINSQGFEAKTDSNTLIIDENGVKGSTDNVKVNIDEDGVKITSDKKEN